MSGAAKKRPPQHNWGFDFASDRWTCDERCEPEIVCPPCPGCGRAITSYALKEWAERHGRKIETRHEAHAALDEMLVEIRGGK